jgi:hypothetical protein
LASDTKAQSFGIVPIAKSCVVIEQWHRPDVPKVRSCHSSLLYSAPDNQKDEANHWSGLVARRELRPTNFEKGQSVGKLGGLACLAIALSETIRLSIENAVNSGVCSWK